MTTSAASPADWRTWARHHERALSLGWLAAVALFCLLFAVPASRHWILGKATGAAQRLERRWDARIAEGERLMASGDNEHAVGYLRHLDEVLPAPSPQHARDQDREHVLRLLARAYENTGHTAEALTTYDRLTAYAPRNYANEYVKARAIERMAGDSGGVPLEAGRAYLAALHLFPSHLPSLRGALRFAAGRADSAQVAALYAAYLDALLVIHVPVHAGASRASPGVPADGRAHAVVIDVPPGADSLHLSPAGFAFAIDSIELQPAPTVGHAPASARRLPGTVVVVPPNDSAAVTIPLGLASGGRARLVVRLFKPMDAGTWQFARPFVMRTPAGRDLDARTVTFPTAERADLPVARQWWSVRAGYAGGEP